MLSFVELGEAQLAYPRSTLLCAFPPTQARGLAIEDGMNESLAIHDFGLAILSSIFD